MKATELWSIHKEAGTSITAARVDEVANTETEALLEDLLVASPELLGPSLTLVGRQLPTAGGYLDLLGIDQDGRLVVFELKRGTLTRDAVAQVLDYASDLAERDLDDVAQLIQENSGRGGIEEFSDFLDWYDGEHASDSDALSRAPRMILVGLGVDERARRVVSYLAQTGVPIALLTFHVFEREGELFLARQVEVTSGASPKDGSTAGSKQANRKILLEQAASQGVETLLDEVAGLVKEHLPGAYQWPGKTSYSFSLQETTTEGKPTLRSYVTLYVNLKESGSVLLQLPPRATDAASDGVSAFTAAVPSAQLNVSSYVTLQVKLTMENWSEVQTPLSILLDAISSGWKQEVADEG